MKSKISLKTFVRTAVAVLLLVLIYGFLFPFPWEWGDRKRCVTLLEYQPRYLITANGADRLYFTGFDTQHQVLTGLSLQPCTYGTASYGTAFWYGPWPWLHGCQGYLKTSAGIVNPAVNIGSLQKMLPELLSRQIIRQQERLEKLEKESQHLAYYMRTHTIVDDGYNQMGDYESRFLQIRKQEEAIMKTLQQLLQSGKALVADNSLYRTFTPPSDTSVVLVDTCRLLSTEKGIATLQTSSCQMPEGARSIARPWFNSLQWMKEGSRHMVSFTAFHEGYIHMSPVKKLKASSIPGWIEKRQGAFSSSLPLLQGAVGGPVFDQAGILVGMMDNNRIIPF